MWIRGVRVTFVFLLMLAVTTVGASYLVVWWLENQGRYLDSGGFELLCIILFITMPVSAFIASMIEEKLFTKSKRKRKLHD